MSQSDNLAATKLCNKDTVKNEGLNIWCTGEQDDSTPKVDVIAVQGLGADPYYTWVHKQTKSLWLHDFLPNLIPHARIATYSYKSDWRKANVKTSVRECGEQLLNVLLQHRTEKERPLVFIGHSLGGLIVKQALVLADHGEEFRDIRSSTAGIIFLGTPHQGSDAAVYGVWLAKMVGRDTTLLESLKRNDSALFNIARDFEKGYSNADTVCFYEKEGASYGPLETKFVDQQSASLLGKRAMFLNTDHSGLNKFSGPKDENFLLVGPEINRMVNEAPQKIKERYALQAVGTEKAQKGQACRSKEEARLLETLASGYKTDKDFVSKRVPGTCEWFFDDDRFLEWRDSRTSRLLWVSAGPGCGKSVLARALIDERKVCTNRAPSTVCYFFFKDGQEQRTRGDNALSALLHQLFENTTLIAHAIPNFSRYGEKLREEFTELWEILVKTAADPEAGDIICVLDALDECEEKARNQLIDELVQFFSLEKSCQNPSLNFKFLVTSRPYDDLELKFEKLSGVSTYMRFDGDKKSQRIGQEINLVIDAKIPHITGGFDHEERKHICNRLKAMENRTYLWLFLTIDIIEKSPSNFRRKSDIESLLSNLPANISDAYDRILKRSTDEAKARVLLALIVIAERPLSLKEANMALAIATRERSCRSQGDLELWPVESFGNTVQNWCGLFINVHDERLSLIHQTAREFLIKTSESAASPSRKWEGCLDMAAAHGTMSRICLNYLNFQDIDSIDESRKNECYLLDYAATYWASHYKSQPAELAKSSQNDAMSLCNTSSLRGHWFTIYHASDEHWDPLGDPLGWTGLGWTGLGICSMLGLANVAEGLIDEGADINAQSGHFGNALQAASIKGHDRVIKMLLDRGADVNAQGGHYGNALQAASVYGHDWVIEMLLDRGADVNAQGGHFSNALQAALIYGHDRLIKLLLDRGADVNAQGGRFYGNALQAASAEGHDQMVQVLLDNGAIDVDGKALRLASSWGHDRIVRMLLDGGAELYAEGGACNDALNTAVGAASSTGHDRIVRILRRFNRSAR